MAMDIDDVPVAMPTNEVQIDGVLTRLGDEGVNALYGIRIAQMQKGIDEANAAAARRG